MLWQKMNISRPFKERDLISWFLL